MSTQAFDFGKAVFHFFNVAGRKPAAVLWIGLWQALLTAGLVYLAFATIGDFYFWIISQAVTGHEPNETEVLTRLGSTMTVMPLISIGGMLIALMAQAAWLRLLTRGEMAAVIPFRLGGDELRLFVTNLGLLAVAMGFYFVSLAVTVMLVGGVVAFAGGNGSTEAGLAGGFVAAMIFLALVLAAVFAAVRLSAAPATTILEKRIAFPAWSMTRGIFWPLLGAYVLVAIIIGVLSAIIGTVLNITLLGAFMPLIGEFAELAQSGSQPPPEEIMAMLEDVFTRPGVLTSITAVGLLSVILRSFADAVWHSVGASVAIQRGTVEAAQ
ncbi:hypothetical protein [Hyphobacterium sp.]|uniref:hypothetical protein n=1 Tax=Hyphobacterium sp. TaxID=2004662 RepID=UPI003B528C76